MPTTFRATIGRDERGRILREHLAQAGAIIDPASFGESRTSTAVATIQPDRHADYEFDIDWDPGVVTAPAGAALVHTGSIATVLRPGSEAVLALFESLRGDTLLSFDPNARPSVTPDRAAAVADVERLAALSHIVKLSDEDAAWMHPDLDLDGVLDHYLGLGVALVAITRGGDGCLAATSSDRIAMPSLPVAVVDTIGAGDAFMSGLLFAVLSGGLVETVRSGRLSRADLEAVAATALRSARVTVSRAGANPPTPGELAAE